MIAVIETGGRQYKVAQGQTIKVELLGVEPGNDYVFDNVLLVADGDNIKVGEPKVAGATVKAVVVDNVRAKKIKIIKHKRRKHHMKQMGHRQHLTELEIKAIEVK